MRIVVDLNRCLGGAQCAFLAPDAFKLNGEEALMYDLNPWLEYYAAQIERSAPFPPPPAGFDHPADMKPVPAVFPDPRIPTGIPDVVLTGHDPTERGAEFRAPNR